MTNRDSAALFFAVIVHVLLGVALAMTPRRPPKDKRILVVDVRKKEPPPQVVKPEPPKPEPVPEPEKPKVKRPPEVAKAPPPNKTEPPKEPPREPPKPVFGVSMDSTTEGDSSFAVPVGNTTVTDPKNLGKPGEAAPLPPVQKVAPQFVPASPLDVSRDAEVDDDPFASTPYPEGEAKNLGIEGVTLLRIEVDERGKVHKAELVRGVGGGPAGAELDRLALRLARQMRFKPALDKKGRPVPVVISAYRVNWELNR